MQKGQKTLISREEVQTLFGIKGFIGKLASSMIMSLLKLNKLNKLYNQIYEDDDILKFTQNCIDIQKVKVKTFPEDINSFPNSGPCIVFFNHPYGLLDAIVIINVLLKIRPDIKITGNFLLKRITVMAPYIMGVNPFENKKEIFSSHKGLRQMYNHLENNGCIIILPAGEVSTKYGKNKFVEDKNWQTNMMKFAINTKVPVISGFCSGQNSKLFHFAGKINPSFRTALLPRELLNKKNIEVIIRLSNPLSAKAIARIKDPNELGRFLKSRTYLLNPYERKEKNITKYSKLKEFPSKDLVLKEIDALRNDKFMLLKNDNYSCFFIDKSDAPILFDLLTILREKTFREVGEGTSKAFDTDNFDNYYKHLFLWDDTSESIVGAYRIGLGKEISEKFGIKGFYLNSLFRFTKEFEKVLFDSIEMGRSFIVSEYQRKPLPLFLLWKGIYKVTQKYSEYKYLIGPASISNEYLLDAKILMVEFLKRNYFESHFQKYVSPQNPYIYKINHHHNNILNYYREDLDHFDKFIKDIDIERNGFPVLIKKYLFLGGKIINFNVDPEFNYSIDGLVILDISAISKEVIDTYSK